MHGIGVFRPLTKVILVQGKLLRQRCDVRRIFVEEDLAQGLISLVPERERERAYRADSFLETLQLR